LIILTTAKGKRRRQKLGFSFGSSIILDYDKEEESHHSNVMAFSLLFSTIFEQGFTVYK